MECLLEIYEGERRDWRVNVGLKENRGGNGREKK